MRCLFLFGFLFVLTIASPTIKIQDPENDQKIMDFPMQTGDMKTYENNSTNHSQVKAKQEKTHQQYEHKVVMDNRQELSTNDVSDAQAKTNETMLNKQKRETAAEMSSTNIKYFHKRSAVSSNEQNDSTMFIDPDYSSEDKVTDNPGDTSETDDSANSNDSNITGSSEFSISTGSSESRNPFRSMQSDNLSSSEEFTYNYDSQETAHVGSDEISRSSALNGVTIQSDSSEPHTHNIFTTLDDISENSNESQDPSIKVDAELSSESQSSSSFSETNDQSDSSKSSSSSDSSDSSEPMTVTTTDKII